MSSSNHGAGGGSSGLLPTSGPLKGEVKQEKKRNRICTTHQSDFVSFHPDGITAEYRGRSHHTMDVGAVRAARPLSGDDSVYYFEVQVVDASLNCTVAVGLVDGHASLNMQPGVADFSWGYRSGQKFFEDLQGDEYGPSFGKGDIVGCGLIPARQELFFTKNGVHLGVAFRGVSGRLYAAASMHQTGEKIRLCFDGPFMFNIDALRKAEDEKAAAEVDRIHSDHALLGMIVREYLLHQGYSSSLRALERTMGQSSVAPARRTNPAGAKRRCDFRASKPNGRQRTGASDTVAAVSVAPGPESSPANWWEQGAFQTLCRTHGADLAASGVDLDIIKSFASESKAGETLSDSKDSEDGDFTRPGGNSAASKRVHFHEPSSAGIGAGTSESDAALLLSMSPMMLPTSPGAHHASPPDLASSEAARRSGGAHPAEGAAPVSSGLFGSSGPSAVGPAGLITSAVSLGPAAPMHTFAFGSESGARSQAGGLLRTRFGDQGIAGGSSGGRVFITGRFGTSGVDRGDHGDADDDDDDNDNDNEEEGRGGGEEQEDDDEGEASGGDGYYDEDDNDEGEDEDDDDDHDDDDDDASDQSSDGGPRIRHRNQADLDDSPSDVDDDDSDGYDDDDGDGGDEYDRHGSHVHDLQGRSPAGQPRGSTSGNHRRRRVARANSMSSDGSVVVTPARASHWMCLVSFEDLEKIKRETLPLRSRFRKLILSGRSDDATALLQTRAPYVLQRTWHGVPVSLLLECQHVADLIRSGDWKQATLDAQRLLSLHLAEPEKNNRPVSKLIEEVMGMLAYADPFSSPHRELLTDMARDATADIVNEAILEYAAALHAEEKSVELSEYTDALRAMRDTCAPSSLPTSAARTSSSSAAEGAFAGIDGQAGPLGVGGNADGGASRRRRSGSLSSLLGSWASFHRLFSGSPSGEQEGAGTGTGTGSGTGTGTVGDLGRSTGVGSRAAGGNIRDQSTSPSGAPFPFHSTVAAAAAGGAVGASAGVNAPASSVGLDPSPVRIPTSTAVPLLSPSDAAGGSVSITPLTRGEAGEDGSSEHAPGNLLRLRLVSDAFRLLVGEESAPPLSRSPMWSRFMAAADGRGMSSDAAGNAPSASGAMGAGGVGAVPVSSSSPSHSLAPSAFDSVRSLYRNDVATAFVARTPRSVADTLLRQLVCVNQSLRAKAGGIGPKFRLPAARKGTEDGGTWADGCSGAGESAGVPA